MEDKRGRPKGTPAPSEMLEVAQRFHQAKQNKTEISRQTGFHARKVTWLLEEAEKRGIVAISINTKSYSRLTKRLKLKYPHLHEVRIVPGGALEGRSDYAKIVKRLATDAAVYFEDQVEQHSHQSPGEENTPFRVGISGGETLLAFVSCVPEKPRPNLHIHVTALVGLGRLELSAAHIDPSTNALILWAKSGRHLGRCHLATVTPYDIPNDEVDPRRYIAGELAKLASNKAITPVLRDMDDVDMVFTSIGTLLSPVEDLHDARSRHKAKDFRERITALSILEPLIKLDDLEAEGAVANLSYCLIDPTGKSRPEWEFFLTAGYNSNKRGIAFYEDMVKRKKTVVAIAGPYKIEAIRAALKARAFNVWITDEDSAEQIASGE